MRSWRSISRAGFCSILPTLWCKGGLFRNDTNSREQRCKGGTDNLDTDTKPTIEKIEVKPYMTVRLIGRDDRAFHVSSETAENQMVPDDGFAEWRFTVQAIESGDHILDLEVGVRAKNTRSKDELTFQPNFHRTIHVIVNRSFAWKRFWNNNWKWVLGGAGTTILALIPIFQGLRKRKSSGDVTSEGPEDTGERFSANSLSHPPRKRPRKGGITGTCC